MCILFIVNVYTDCALGNCLSGALNLTQKADKHKYGYSRYDIGFNLRFLFLVPNSGWGKNVIMFGVGNSSLVHVDKRKYIYINFL